ncbi:lytic transglycosylase [Parachitinimonas caeni]|uniref:LysM peptidoglycan-binding domain-containing protein n=1 Tax=Parachitinimonas caeni TaxID=3031301 RepID=A0ABT7DSI4_9NEIS|nr:LysM peptidoglycan-binding domain-containing protein [Parachitinimonas caeni]MDK2123033.1 LysM peptidoglycan-binding domain-containing protein [Parachitinimonas caeni]
MFKLNLMLLALCAAFSAPTAVAEEGAGVGKLDYQLDTGRHSTTAKLAAADPAVTSNPTQKTLDDAGASPESPPLELKVESRPAETRTIEVVGDGVKSEAKATNKPEAKAEVKPESKPDVMTGFRLNNRPDALQANTSAGMDELSGASPLASGTDVDLWNRIRGGFAIQQLDDPLVRQHEQWYAKRPDYMKRVIDRSKRYLYFIVSEVEKRGMPTEIALLPIIESAFNPKAESYAAASGMWQFIPSTGKRYGLERTWWYDGRRDVMAATRAALDYLQTLHDMFGDWQLALAAYNWGEGGVARALSKTRAQGIEGNFSSIKMPDQTRNYVPKLLAVRNIIAHPEQYGVKLDTIPDQPYFQPISTGRHMDVKLIAKLAETSMDELLHLNPGLIRPVFAYKDDRKLLLPADKAEVFQENLSQYKQPLLSWQPYVTKRGEALDAVAKRFDISLAELKDVNKIPVKQAKADGQTILVPIVDGVDISARQTLAAALAGAKQAEPESTVAEAKPSAAKKPTSYTIQRGDTLASVAKRFDTNAAELKKLNKLKSEKLALGQVIKLVEASSAVEEKAGKGKGRDKADKAPKEQQYVVQRGDTLASIARKFKVEEAALRKWNQLGSRQAIRAGNKMVILVAAK